LKRGLTTSTSPPPSLSRCTNEPYTYTKEPSTYTKEPYTYTKEPCKSVKKRYVSVKEPYTSTKEPCIYTEGPHTSVKEPCTSVKQRYISVKEPYMSCAKEPYTSTKEPCISTKEPYTSVKQCYITYQEKSPKCFAQQRWIYVLHKRAPYIHKRALYIRKTELHINTRVSVKGAYMFYTLEVYIFISINLLIFPPVSKFVLFFVVKRTFPPRDKRWRGKKK